MVFKTLVLKRKENKQKEKKNQKDKKESTKMYCHYESFLTTHPQEQQERFGHFVRLFPPALKTQLKKLKNLSRYYPLIRFFSQS